MTPTRQWRIKPSEVKVSEAALQRAVVRYLSLRGFCFTQTDAERSWNRTGSIRVKRRIHPGWPDITLVIRGRAIFFELKTRTGTVSAKQLACHQLIESNGGKVYIVRSLDDAIAALWKEEAVQHSDDEG